MTRETDAKKLGNPWLQQIVVVFVAEGLSLSLSVFRHLAGLLQQD